MVTPLFVFGVLCRVDRVRQAEGIRFFPGHCRTLWGIIETIGHPEKSQEVLGQPIFL